MWEQQTTEKNPNAYKVVGALSCLERYIETHIKNHLTTLDPAILKLKSCKEDSPRVQLLSPTQCESKEAVSSHYTYNQCTFPPTKPSAV